MQTYIYIYILILKFGKDQTNKPKHQIKAERMQIPLTIIHLLEFDVGSLLNVGCWLCTELILISSFLPGVFGALGVCCCIILY